LFFGPFRVLCACAANWQSVPDIDALNNKTQTLIESLDGREITIHQGHSQAEDLYAQLERALVFEQHFKGNQAEKKDLQLAVITQKSTLLRLS